MPKSSDTLCRGTGSSPRLFFFYLHAALRPKRPERACLAPITDFYSNLNGHYSFPNLALYRAAPTASITVSGPTGKIASTCQIYKFQSRNQICPTNANGDRLALQDG
jgi:hypothetical protein